MRVAVVTPEIDAHPTSGGAIRTLRLVQALSRRAQTELFVVGHDTDLGALRDATGATVRSFSGTGGLTVRTLAARHGWPLEAARRWSAAADEALRAARCDVTVLDHVYTAPYAAGRYVMSLHNVEAEVRAELPWPRGLAAADHAWDRAVLPSFERRAVARAPRVVTVSQRDAGLLGTPAVVVQNGADLPAVVRSVPSRGRIVYVGSMSWAPNRLAVEWWLSEVAPLLPDRTLTVVGRGGREAFGGSTGLDVMDVVPDVGAVLAESRVVVVPLRHGGGTRLKVLEAFAHGRPVVTTTKGVDGLPVRPDVHALVADDPAAFAEHVRAVLADDALARRLAAAGRELVSSYDWHVLGERFADVVLG